MAAYKKVPLGELCDLTAGPSGSLLENLHEGLDGVPVITPPDLTEQHTVDTRRMRRIPQRDAEKLSRFTVREGDIVFVRQGTLGRLALINAEQAKWLYSSACLRIRPYRQFVLPAYLASYLSYAPVQKVIVSHALRGTVPSINPAMLRELQVTLPPMEQQREITETLADIDGQVRTQREIANRLEVLGQAVFGEMVHEQEHV